MGIHGLGGGLGLFAAPFLIGVLAELFKWRGSLGILAIPALAAALLLFVELKEIGTISRVDVNVRDAITRSGMLLIIVSGLVQGVEMSAFISFAPTFLVQVSGLTLIFTGLLVTLATSANILGQPVLGWISDKVSRRNVLVFVGIAQGIFITLFALLPYPFNIVMLWLINFLSVGGVVVSWAFISELVPSKALATAMGLMSMINGYIGIACATAAGWLIESYGFRLAFIFSAAFSIVGGVAAVFLPKSKR